LTEPHQNLEADYYRQRRPRNRHDADQASWYPEIWRQFSSHDTVNHSAEEYVRREDEKIVTINPIEGYYYL
jgi:hypothetical protein